MKKYHLLYFFAILMIVYGNNCFSSTSADSLGVINKSGLKYIIHEVEAGETLFALSRKYGVDVQAIKDANTESVSALSIGQRIMIPLLQPKAAKTGKYHIVKPSETLFSISRQYDVKVDDLIQLNNLTDNSISIGQELKVSTDTNPEINADKAQQANSTRKTHVVKKSQTLFAISRMYDVSTAQLREWNMLSSDELNIGQVLFVSAKSGDQVSDNSSMLPYEKEGDKGNTKPEPQPEQKAARVPIETKTLKKEETTTISETDLPAEKVVQKGFAEVIENTTETKKYLALHRDAQIGTIMQVRNEMNNQSVFVRIVGTIPATGDNAKVILKISKKAYDRLGAVDSRFPVEVSYIP